jgi:excinuclease ABC subunit A
MKERRCDACNGMRLNPYAESVYILDKKISELSSMEISELERFFKENKSKVKQGAVPLIDELTKRLHNLTQVGLGYLTLSRSSETLSGGEAQRIRLGVQFDSFLSGVLYVLDEPTIGLHTQDTVKVINAFKRLKKEGNTVVIVEHDRLVLENADFIFDIGPGAGNNGGRLIASGTPSAIKKNKNSITGKYLAYKKVIPCRKVRRKPDNGKLKVIGARHNNLRNLDVEIPLGNFICVTGVSGSGKSSLVYDVIAKALARQYHKSEKEAGEYERMEGTENLDKVIKIDQSPIGRTPRSNLATYTGIFTSIRELFASTAESKLRGFSASRFSFNLKGGRCEACRGDGFIKIEMYFMPDVYTKCEECSGTRYNKETLEIKFKEKNISEVLEMTVDDAFSFFEFSQEIRDKLMVLRKVGLGYLSLGQSATTLSGGEAQRVKLATELSRPSTGKTIYILDEPTTGLHFEDISRLLIVLQELVDRGNTVIVIEHNLDIIKNADHIIDMGPGGGDEGGFIIAQGSPENISLNKKSATGEYLAEILRHS